jgi:uncharacterized protein YndB with AHSA1/START domain
MGRRWTGFGLALAGLALLGAGEARCEVLDATPGGFAVKSVATIAAPRARVYDALLAVGRWWDPAHSYSGDAKNLSIDARPGGCFCETLPDQGGVQHAMVVLVMPGKTLRLVGGLGPLQESGLQGSLTFALADREGGTDVTMSYSVGGYRQGGLAALAPIVDTVLGAQLRRLQSFVEKGAPVPAP